MSAFDDVNQRFHAAYDEARAAHEAPAPVLVVLADSMMLHRGRERWQLQMTPPLFHVIKAAAHTPLALFSLLERCAAGPLDAATRARLARLARAIDDCAAALSADVIGGERAIGERLRAILDQTAAFVAPLVEGAAWAPAQLTPFARGLGPTLLLATHDATRLQLDALDRAVTTLLARLDVHERRALQVVVAGVHQARTRSLAMQYFGKLLAEPPGAELRLTYAENVTEEEEALALVATRRFDRALAEAFFGDPHRLQRDILGDAVHEQLAARALPPLE